MTSTKTRFWVAGIAIVLVLGFLLVRGLGDATVYFRTADEAVAQRSTLGTRRFRLEGTVVSGSVAESRGDVALRVAKNGVEVPVVHRGDPPEMFRPDMPVVLEGHFQGNEFASDRIMVKHSENYDADHPERVTTTLPGSGQ